MTIPEHEPEPVPAPVSPSRRRRVLVTVAAGVVLALLVVGGWWLTAILSPAAPAGPTVAGVAVCQRQVAINFHDDGDLREHEQQLRQHARVSAVAWETQQQVLDWYRDQLVRAGPATAPLAKVVRIEVMPARAWLAAAPGDLEQVRAEVRAQLGLAAEGVWVTNPCTDQTLSRSATPSPTPAPSSR